MWAEQADLALIAAHVGSICVMVQAVVAHVLRRHASQEVPQKTTAGNPLLPETGFIGACTSAGLETRTSPTSMLASSAMRYW